MPSQANSQKPHKPALFKHLPFAFPFRRKERSARFTNEHEIYRLLAREQSGAYLASRNGLWHGGIHITEASAGQSLDLDAGLRCIADGTLIALRINKTYPLSKIAEGEAPYSTSFALVRHTMEFGAKLTFYSVYMHLMSWDDYANFPQRQKPAHWPQRWQVTQYAQDKPSRGRNKQVDTHPGLRVRKSPSYGTIIGLLPQGAFVSLGKQEKGWGQVVVAWRVAPSARSGRLCRVI